MVVTRNHRKAHSDQVGFRSLRFILIRVFLSIVLAVLGCWVVAYSWPLRSIRHNALVVSEEAAQALRVYPQAQYAFGMHAWLEQQPETAADFFRRAVSRNILFVDAWLRLAETEASMGHEEKARAILAFSTNRTDRVLRWKWSQMVLARELGMDESFYRNANDLLARKVLDQDTLQLLHTHFDGNASAVVSVLEPSHLSTYLEWLTRWGMTDESLVAWNALSASGTPEKETALRYAHFLLGRKRIDESVDIWRKYTNVNGLTNPGFEVEITRQGFDWRYWGEKDGLWELKRAFYDHTEGNYALQISFSGKENIAFQHLYQIFSAIPLERYRLTYRWKSRGITTDQGPFVEVVGYDQQGLRQTGSMMTGTNGWREESIDFTMPPDCRAAMVRLRRRTSMRFDSKISGRIWLDNFRLERVGDAMQATTGEQAKHF